MKTKVIKPLLLTVCLLCSITVSAYDFELDGIYYNIVSMSDLEVEVTYSDMPDHECNRTPYTGHISIPATVNYNNRTFTVIGIGTTAFGYDYNPSSFSSPTNVTSVQLPKTLKYIGKKAFKGCKLQSVEIEYPNSLETIEEEAFAYTTLPDASFLNDVKTIETKAFYASKVSSLVLGKNIESIGAGAFGSCKSLLEVFCLSGTKPSGLSSNTFSGSHSALEVYVPSIAVYGFGKEYVSFVNNAFTYNGKGHDIEWNNNLKAYKCEISESDCMTKVDAGEYTQYLCAKYSNGVDFTIDIPYSYVIKKAPMSLHVNDMSREYGDINPAFTCSISGFVNGENEQNLGITPSFECEATQKSNVGSYRILASIDASNYEVTYRYGNLSVLKAPLSANVINTTKVYGNSNPEFELSFSGLKNDEVSPVWTVKPSFRTSVDARSGVGEYPVSVEGGEAKNYEVTFNSGNLTVVKRELTVKANDCERLYGEENPEFSVSFIGFVNGDGEASLIQKPTAECRATKESDAGKYAITANGGSADNYSFLYQDGLLTINPLSVGFKTVYNSVTYNDMAVSTNDKYFNFIPEIVGPFSEDDFWIELYFMDKDGRYSDYVTTISNGDYAGNYVNTNYDREMSAGKYIFTLTSKGTNPNVIANQARAYVTVNRASNNLEWDALSPITVSVGERVELGISYQANLWCLFNTSYDEELISLESYGETGRNPHWYAVGLKEGETTLYFGIECRKNDMGFYDFSDSRTLSKRIKVIPSTGIEKVISGNDKITISVSNGNITVSNKPEDVVCRVFTINGTMVTETKDDVIGNLSKGMYIVKVGEKSSKIILK